MVIHATDRPDLSRVTDGTLMFQDCSLLNQDISDWDVSHFTQMGGMFRGAKRFNQDISSWNVSHVYNMQNMFYRSPLSTLNYDSILNGWAMLSLRSNVTLGANQTHYSEEGRASRQYLIDNFGWNIVDAGEI